MIGCGARVEQLSVALQDARVRGSGEAVHQLRVASRRLDAWLGLGGVRVLRDDLAWLRRTCGTMRNLDVLSIDEELPAAFLGWVSAQRDVESAAVRRTLADPRADAVVAAVRLLPAIPKRSARRGLSRVAARVRRRGKRANALYDDVEALHALRRAVRALRYAGEWLGEQPGVVIDVQDAFGALNDAAVLASTAARWGAVDPEFRALIDDRTTRAHDDVVRAWKDARPELLDWTESWTST